MEELIEKVDNLKKTLDNCNDIIELKKINQEIMKDKDLLKDIEEYNLTKNEKIKERIINHSLFREYKKKETDCNILIMAINQSLKKINHKGYGCK